MAATETRDAKAIDRKLIEGALANDQTACRELVERYWRLVYAIGYAHVADRDTAEDLTQEIFLRIFLNLKSYDIERPFTPWLTSVARNLAINWARSGQRRSRVLVSLPDEIIEQIGDGSGRESELKAMERQEEEGLLKAMLYRLPSEQREIVLLHYMEDLNKKEIAERLGVHPSTVGRQLKQALRTLRGGVESALADGVAAVRPHGQLLGRTMALAAAAVALGGEAKAVLASAAGGLPATGPALSFKLSAGGLTAAAPGLLGAGKVGLLALLGVVAAYGVHEARPDGALKSLWPWAAPVVNRDTAHKKAESEVKDRFAQIQGFAAAGDQNSLIDCFDLPDWSILTGLDMPAVRKRILPRVPGLAKILAASKLELVSVDSDDPILLDVEYGEGKQVHRLEIDAPIVAVKAGDWHGRFVRNAGVWKILDQQLTGASAEKNGVIDMIKIQQLDDPK